MNLGPVSFPWVSLGTAMVATMFAMPVRGAELKQAIVTQKVNKVTLAQTAQAAAEPVSTGAVVKDDNVVRTGVQSRAELEFGDKTVARLGASTTFSFDVNSSTLDFKQGSALFCKPKGTGPLQIRTAAVTAAITGTTGFISTMPTAPKKNQGGPAAAGQDVVLFGIVEGSMKGTTVWYDKDGKARKFRFALGPGEMLVSQPGLQPMVANFDLARFVSTSPLMNGFSSTLANAAQIAHQVAVFESLVSRGFVEPGSVMLANFNNQVMFVGNNQPVTTRFDAGISQLTAIADKARQDRLPAMPMSAPVQQTNLIASNMAAAPVNGGGGGGGGFQNVGGSGTIRGQLIWQSAADLDLHLLLPDTQHVYYGNRTATFNGGAATASLDADNLGGVINTPPNNRVENIVVTGTPASGNYSFYVRSFSTPNPSDPCTLLVTGNGGLTTQTLNCNLNPGQETSRVTVTVP